MKVRNLLLLAMTLGLGAAHARAQGTFGHAVALGDFNGDGFGDMVVGDPTASPSGPELGRVNVYHGFFVAPSATPSWSATGRQLGEHFGSVLLALADFNGDGYDDLVVAAPGHDVKPRKRGNKLQPIGSQAPRPAGDHGRVVLYPGSAGGLWAQPAWQEVGRVVGERFGSALTAGDFNGDGYGDLVVGATGAFDGLGGVFVFHGGPTGLADTPYTVLTGPAADVGFGSSLAGNGDADGDGYDDLAIGRPGAGGGRVWVHRGAWFGIGYGAGAWEVNPSSNFVRYTYGATVAWAGDVDADGFEDLLVADPTFFSSGGHGSLGASNAGIAFLMRGSDAGPMPGRTIAVGESTGARLGTALAGLGDLDGDGFDEFGVTAPGRTIGSGSRGRVRAFDGETGIPQGFHEIVGPVPGSFFGASLAGGMDLTGDGVPDLVIGEPFPVDPAENGRVHLHGGGGTGGISSFTIVYED